MDRLLSVLLTPQDAPISGLMLARLVASLFERKPLLMNGILSMSVAGPHYGVTVVREWLFFLLVGSGLLGISYLAYRVLRRVSRRGWLDAVVLLGGLGVLVLGGMAKGRLH